MIFLHPFFLQFENRLIGMVAAKMCSCTAALASTQWKLACLSENGERAVTKSHFLWPFGAAF
ncbi:hypothetical protein A1A1_03052 [Planococcus antarcticus DSM 14505]|uniref:Uncharacterized protein n=1 Tax=Planococcus antarcticus DSM 14505 TaxID=1185653 RepID=A0AA87LTF9_9BACL|nr:hypothetical protein A1A1_03052 [Planococcus antarcticus DSM 14505]